MMKDRHKAGGTEGGAHHVTLYSKNSVSQTLYCDPFDRHLSDSALPVIISAVDFLR